MKKTFVSRTMSCLAALLMLTGGWRTNAAYLADALNEVYEVNIDTQNRPFAWPIPDSNSISSCFKDGREHNAIDIPAPQGTRVNAAADGVVTVAATGCTHNYGKSKSCGCNNGAGNYIMIRHDIGGTTYYTCYMHLTSVQVAKGDSVKCGAQIGTSGSTGYSGGFHLDFSIRKDQSASSYAVDPGYYTQLPSKLVYKGTSPNCCLPWLKEVTTTAGPFDKSSSKSSNEAQIYKYLTEELGFNTAVACAALANIDKESGFDPQNSYLEKDGGLSYGICQWHLTRFDGLKSFCSKKGYDYRTLDAQLKYLKYEFENSYQTQYQKLLTYPDTKDGCGDASYYWAEKFEVCAKSQWDVRKNYAMKEYWPKYHTGPEDNYVIIHYNSNDAKMTDQNTAYYVGNGNNVYRKSDNKLLGPKWKYGYQDEYGLVDYDTIGLTPGEPGLYFAGWCRDPNGRGTIWAMDDPKVSANDIYPEIEQHSGEVTLYAIYRKYNVAIRYNANHGMLTPDSKYHLASDNTIIRTADGVVDLNNWQIDTTGGTLYNASTFGLIKLGYRFIGYSTRGIDRIFDQDEVITAKDVFPDIVSKNGTCLFYARWEANVLTVHYALNGGCFTNASDYCEKGGMVSYKSDGSLRANRYKYDTDVNLCNCTTLGIYKSGFRFVGWELPDGTVIDEDQNIKAQDVCAKLAEGDQEITVRAKWELVSPTVKIYTNTSGRNYILGSDLDCDRIETLGYDGLSTNQVEELNGERILTVSITEDDTEMKTRKFSLQTSLSDCASYSGEMPSPDTYYLSFYASAASGAKLGARFGYTALEKSVELTDKMKWYSIKLNRTELSDNWIHFHFSSAGAYKLSHLMLTDHEVKEGDFIAESETEPVTVLTSDSENPQLPVLTQEGYRLKGYFTQRTDGTQVTELDMSQSMILYAQWEYDLPDSISMTFGEQCSLSLPETLTFKSGNPDVLYIAPSGTMTAVGTGNAILFVLENGEIIKQISVNVAAEAPKAQMLPGDVDGSGDVNVADAVLLARFLAEDTEVSVSTEGKVNANINGDDEINSADLSMLLEILADIRAE